MYKALYDGMKKLNCAYDILIIAALMLTCGEKVNEIMKMIPN